MLCNSNDTSPPNKFLFQVVRQQNRKNMESCSNQKSVKQIKIYLRFFKVATLYLDDSFAHSLHSLNLLHLGCFSNSLEWVATYAEHLLAAFPSFCGPTHPKPSQLGWGRVIVEARSPDAALHHFPWLHSLEVCFGSLSCWKTNYSPTKHKTDGMAYRCRMLC